jgi:hypothetical protein
MSGWLGSVSQSFSACCGGGGRLQQFVAVNWVQKLLCWYSNWKLILVVTRPQHNLPRVISLKITYTMRPYVCQVRCILIPLSCLQGWYFPANISYMASCFPAFTLFGACPVFESVSAHAVFLISSCAKKHAAQKCATEFFCWLSPACGLRCVAV